MTCLREWLALCQTYIKIRLKMILCLHNLELYKSRLFESRLWYAFRVFFALSVQYLVRTPYELSPFGLIISQAQECTGWSLSDIVESLSKLQRKDKTD